MSHASYCASSKRYREANKELIADKKRKYYEANKEEICAKSKRYREENKEKLAAKRKEGYETKKEKIAATRKKYYESHKDELNIKDKQRYHENKEQVMAAQKRYRESNKAQIAATQSQYREQNKNEIAVKYKQYRASKKFACIYVAASGERPGKLKVGCTTLPEIRLSQFRVVDYSMKFLLIAPVYDEVIAEKAVHNEMDQFFSRVHGEWFTVNETDYDAFCYHIVKFLDENRHTRNPVCALNYNNE